MKNAQNFGIAGATLLVLATWSGTAKARESLLQLSAGSYHTCGVTTARTVKCWGTNSKGQIGDGTTTNRSEPVDVTGLPANARAVSAGGESTCALMEDGSVWCWGSNQFAQLGTGTTSPSAPPRVVSAVRDAVAIDNGGAQACAITRDARVLCWGFHYTEAQCSYDFFRGTTCSYTPHVQSTPAEVAGLRGARELRTSPFRGYGSPDIGPSVCAVDELGAVRCADRFDRDVTMISGMEQGIRSLAIYVGNPCGVTAAGALTCETWRSGSYVVARQVPGMDRDIVAIGAVGDTVCAVTRQGRVQCSGSTLGDGTLIRREVPIEASGLRDVVSIAAGMQHACALLTNGEAFCWGRNSGGRTGSGSSLDYVVAPLGVAGFSERVLADAPGPLTGIWWNPSESGWGLQIADRRDTSVVALFSYDAAGRAKWYFASNCVLGSNALETAAQCSSPLHEFRGPAFPSGAFDARPVQLREAGTLRLQFSGRNSATATVTLDGLTRTKPVERYSFRVGANPLSVDYSDFWWNPQEAGWGLAVTHQADKMFLIWYAYESGEPVWYFVADCVIGESRCSGELFRSTGPAFGPIFDPAQVKPVATGTATLSFVYPNNATLSYSIQGVNGSRAVTRYRF